MQTIGIIVLLLIGFLLFRFFSRAKSMAKTASTVMRTGQKINMAIQMARQKSGALVKPGPMTSEKQFYIGYVTAIADEQARVDGEPTTMFRALVKQEARNITSLPEGEDITPLYESCLESEAGIDGVRLGKIDGQKLADIQTSQPYFVELDMWLSSHRLEASA